MSFLLGIIYLIFIVTAKVLSIPVQGSDLIISIPTSPDEREKRDKIRECQIETYKGYNITWRFVLAMPEDKNLELILKENATYHDIMLLEGVQDSIDFARKDKSYHFFRYLIDDGFHYKYVAKLDSDAFLNITGFVEKYFTESVRNKDSTIIAYPNDYIVNNVSRIIFPQGGVYVLSWDLVEKVNKAYQNKSISRETDLEDVQIAIYLERENVTFIHIKEEHNFDYDEEKKTEDQIREAHASGFQNIIRVHELKLKPNIVSRFETGVLKYVNVSTYFKDWAEENTKKSLIQENETFEQLKKADQDEL